MGWAELNLKVPLTPSMLPAAGAPLELRIWVSNWHLNYLQKSALIGLRAGGLF